jgi:hypothetical protein
MSKHSAESKESEAQRTPVSRQSGAGRRGERQVLGGPPPAAPRPTLGEREPWATIRSSARTFVLGMVAVAIVAGWIAIRVADLGWDVAAVAGTIVLLLGFLVLFVPQRRKRLNSGSQEQSGSSRRR